MNPALARAAVAGLLCAYLVTPGTATAGEAARLGLTPVGQPGAYVELTLAPGERHEAHVEAANFGNEVAAARTYAADAYTIVNGGFGADLYGAMPTGTTGWLNYPMRQLNLEPREALRLPLVISVPVGTPPGDYLAALVIESTATVPSSGPVSLSQVNRSAIAVAIAVPGPRDPRLVIGTVKHRAVAGHSILAFEVENPGNAHLRPAGRFALLSGDGTPMESASVTMDSVYASTGTLLEVPLRDALPAGDYCAELSLTDPATGAHDQTDCQRFSVTGPAAPAGPDDDREHPLPAALPETSAIGPAGASVLAVMGGALVCLALLLGARRRRRERRRGRDADMRVGQA